MYFRLLFVLFSPTPRIERVVDAFLDLVSLETMNGAVLFVSREGKMFMETRSFELGKIYPPAL